MKLSYKGFRTYDWVNDNGYENLGKWIEAAYERAQNRTKTMQSMNLSDSEKQQIIDSIKEGSSPLPKEYIYKLYADDEDVFLFWNGRNETVINAVLPFHSIEHIDEPCKEVEPQQVAMFDTTGRQLKGWTNELIWGDNRLILSSLVNGPLWEEIEKQGGLKLIYIDPPFAVGADFSYNITVNGEDVTKQQSINEEIAYCDTWGGEYDYPGHIDV